jgi:hypothetical protein
MSTLGVNEQTYPHIKWPDDNVVFPFYLQLNTRKDACEGKSTVSRNEYLLSMAACNAHLVRFYQTDMPELMQVMYLTLPDSFMSILSESNTVQQKWPILNFLTSSSNTFYNQKHCLVPLVCQGGRMSLKKYRWNRMV